MAAPYILAKTLLDAHTFARETLGLGKGHYRVVTSPSSISGRRGTKLYLVPGYEKRHDRFAMKGALKYTRLEKIDAADLLAEEPVETPDGLEPAGVQLAITEGADTALLADFEAFLDAGSPEPSPLVALVTDGEHETEESLLEAATDEVALALTPAEVEQVEEALAEEPDAKPTRRRRCKECGLLIEPDEVEAHAAEHLPTEE